MESSNMHVGRFIFAPTEVKAGFPVEVMVLAENNTRDDHDLNSRDDNVDQDLVSDGESGGSSISIEEGLRLFNDGLVIVDEEDKQLQFIKQKFLSGLVHQGLQPQVEAVHKNVFSSLTSQAKLHSFLMFSRIMQKKNEGCANVKYAWFGGSKDEIKNIFKHGFGHTSKNAIYGHGIYLSPLDSPFASLQSSVVDEDGLSHIVLCRVILGRMELVHPAGSVQYCPSSEEFDSGVDNLSSPHVYIVWSTHVNTHILPQYMISFRPPSNLNEVHKIAAPFRKPNSPWMPFPTLISELAKVLPHNTIRLLQKFHGDHGERKITRQELIQKVRRLVGDDLLVRIIKSYKDKLVTSKKSTPNSNLYKWKKLHGPICVCSKKTRI